MRASTEPAVPSSSMRQTRAGTVGVLGQPPTSGAAEKSVPAVKPA